MLGRRDDIDPRSAIFSLILVCLTSGCSAVPTSVTSDPPKADARTITANEALAVQSRVVDCEWKAVNRYDDGTYTVSQLAQRIMGLCAVELTRARLTFHLSPNDPDVELDEFKHPVEVVEGARKSKTGAK